MRGILRAAFVFSEEHRPRCTLLPTVVITVFVMKMELWKALAVAFAQSLILHPLLNRCSKLTWLYAEGRMTKMLDG